jgi:hypothetical protein
MKPPLVVGKAAAAGTYEHPGRMLRMLLLPPAMPLRRSNLLKVTMLVAAAVPPLWWRPAV